nr:fibronectin type III domain-containing protein [Bacteroidales bacterium]
MNKKSLLFLLLTALFAPWAAYAQQNSLTLYEDATETSYAIPMYVLWFDFFTRSQTVFPAEDLEEMAGGTITAIKFYTTNQNIPYTTVSAADIYLTEVESPTISSFIDKSMATVVCQGYFDFVAADGGGEVTLTLTTPYVYQGGNLLFGCDNTEDVGYKSIRFYGKTANGASISGYYADAGGIINPINSHFLPKTTFTYEPGAVSCQRPTSIAVTNITTVGATVTWEGEGNTWNLRYKASSDAYWTEITGLTNTSYNLTGLTAGTVYTVQVQSVCDDLTSGWKSSSFNTLCTAITSLPWNEDFEDYNTSNFTPACWVNEHIAGSQNQTFRITTSTLGGNSGRKLYLPSMSSGNMVKLCLPEMTLSTDTDYRFVLDIYRSSASNSNEGIRVFASTDGEIEGATELAFIPRLYSVSNDVIPAEPLANTWYTYELPIPLHGTCYIILRGESGGDGTYLDNFVVEPISNCLRPTDLTVTNLSLHSATIGWTSDNENFQIRYRKSSESNNWTMVNNPSHPHTLTDLEPGIRYVVEVRSVCGGDDGESRWALTSFTTPTCAAPSNLAVSNVRTSSATVNWTGNSDSYIVKYGRTTGDAPFKEDFEDAASFANWTFTSNNSQNDIGTTDGAGRYAEAAHSGAYGFRFASWNYIGWWVDVNQYKQYLLSPVLNVTGELKFYYKKHTANPNRDPQLKVGYATTTTTSGYYYWSDAINPTTEWQLYIQQLPSNVTQVIICFGEDSDSYVYIDDITIGSNGTVPDNEWNYITTEATSVTLNNLSTETEYKVIVTPTCNETYESNAGIFTTFPCLAPENVAVSNTTMTSATLNWTGHSESYTVKRRTAAYFDGITIYDFSGWTRYTGPLNPDGTGPTTPVHDGWTYLGGDYYSSLYPNNRNWMVTPAITVNAGCSLSFKVCISGDLPWSPGNGGQFDVLISTDNKAHWTILREWNNTGSPYIWNNLVGPYQTINDINLNAYIGQTVYIAFYVTSYSSTWRYNQMNLSDVTCGRPIAAGAWQTVLSTAANTATIGNLYPDTKYDAVVVSSCDPTLVSDIVSFRTVGCSVDEVEVSDIMEQSATVNWNSYSDGYTVKYRKTPIVSYPYEMGFEDENSFANWTFISNNAANALGTTNGAGIHHTAAHGGLLGFRFSSYNTVEGGEYNAGDYIQYLISPLLNVSGNLRFYYRKSNRLYEGLSVGYSTTTNNLN